MTTTSRRRGYMLLEAMVGGAVLAVALSSAMSFVGFYRRETTMAARRAEASAIATAVTDELVTRPFGTGVGSAPNYQGHRNFNVTWTIAQSGVHANSTPALTNADELHLITVTVTFPSMQGPPSSLVYQRLKRNPQ